ncbi:6,7-dimethyl-8-ribityllumazine synthase [Candidatus Uhrbacteria bacterium]|nr:6,7-dimethyl-8-ribityllumazine synthase [Candidatus Uhrbacteria bacterium]
MTQTKASAVVKTSKAVHKSARFAIIQARFNGEMTSAMRERCVETLRKNGVAQNRIDVFTVPGSLEIPVVAQKLAKTKKYAALIALGVIIKGDTYHFELVANECARGCMDVSLAHGVPVIFEVLATYSREQALARTGGDAYNKGIEAAAAALEVVQTLATIS